MSRKPGGRYKRRRREAAKPEAAFVLGFEVGASFTSRLLKMALTLNVKLLTGEVHSIHCSSNQTVWDLKTQLGRQSGVNPYQQKLARLDGGSLDLQDGAPLTSYDLRSGDTLVLIVKSEESIPVLLRNTNQRTTTYHVLPSNTVAQFRAQIRTQERIQDDQFWLSYDNQTLSDGCKLSDYNICPGGTVTLNLRLRGGGVRISPL